MTKDEQEKVDGLLKALGYYADDRVYETHSEFTRPVILDAGKRAKSAIKEYGGYTK